ncbi:hypothetical protein HOA55_02590 [archaeon]|jgi:hypothetical protein|nr:hypothetical protein [archaeon]MBT6820216.1 hypothetical protein [archaeon]
MLNFIKKRIFEIKWSHYKSENYHPYKDGIMPEFEIPFQEMISQIKEDKCKDTSEDEREKIKP